MKRQNEAELAELLGNNVSAHKRYGEWFDHAWAYFGDACACRAAERLSMNTTDAERQIKEIEFGIGEGSRFGGWIRLLESDRLVRVVVEWPPDPRLGIPVPPHSIEVARSYFASTEQIKEWFDEVCAVFYNYWMRVMVVETEQHLRDCAYWVLGALKLAPISLDDVIEAHRKASVDNIKYRLGKPVGRGQRSKWSKPELNTAIHDVVVRKPYSSWEDISKVLAQKYPDKAPKSGESLRQLARTHQITLRTVRKIARNVK
ncbi:MAG: hypothetical protein ACR2LC_16715 [Pyrinomonadaceae bacterium]